MIKLSSFLPFNSNTKSNKIQTKTHISSKICFLSFSHANPSTMSPLLALLVIFNFLSVSLSQSQFPKGILINCGATTKSTIDGREWLPDAKFVSGGTPRNLTAPVLVPILSTVQSFPLRNNLYKKFCYVVQVYRSAKYLIRTTYFYGGINGQDSPPVFDQMVDGTLWSVVNTTEDYANGMSSYYEGVFAAQGKTMSVCIGANTYTDSDPFISALEFLMVADSLYNSTDFSKFGLRLVARHAFGYSGPIIRYVILLSFCICGLLIARYVNFDYSLFKQLA
jgi:hypothetical protein